jgi:SsrA-binding protein
MSSKPQEVRSIARNRRAKHEYQIVEELECGIQLRGTEVKSLRAGRSSLAEAYGMIRKGELMLLGMHIPTYEFGNVHNHEPTRERKLLVHRRQIEAWAKEVRLKGTTIVPLEVYFSGSLVKVRVALARGKKLHDKRRATRDRDARRQIDQAMGRRR